MKYLYLIQHAKAMSKEENKERPITDDGKTELKKTAAFLMKTAPLIEEIWHSTKLRSKETAQLLADILNFTGKIVEKQYLNPKDEVEVLESEISVSDKNIAVVGHLPYLSKIASLLITGDKEKNVIQFEKAGIFCLENNSSIWQLKWAVIPEILR